MDVVVSAPGALEPNHSYELMHGVERRMMEVPCDLPPVTHYVGTGTYCREMEVPPDTFVMGHMHRGSTVTVILTGALNTFSNHGTALGHHVAGEVIVTPPATKRLWYSAQGGRIMTIHATGHLQVDPTNEQSMQVLESYLLVKEGENV